ncbi:MAG: hypothetical protein HY763_02065 [Planctomycetes bacterium]|nr:hypothetical protein [Planctomycetota bacterium]
MKRFRPTPPRFRSLPALGYVCAALFVVSGCAGLPRVGQVVFRDSFAVDKANLGPSGGNQYFSLEPGTVSSFRDGDVLLTITVLAETKLVDGVETRVIEEREEEGGQPLEISRNYFAADRTTQDVYYFGEDVDIYENGQIASHDWAWLSGVGGARFGLIMPASAVVGDRYYQEVAPDVALDRAEVVSVSETVETPAGTFTNCLHIRETSPLEAGESHKWYAPGVGLVRDSGALLESGSSVPQ